MSHRNLSWVLTFIAFLLFALACSLGQNVKEDSFPILPEIAFVDIEGLSKMDIDRFPSNSVTADCGIENFYEENPFLAKKMPSVLATALRIKLAEEISSALKENPEQLPQQIRECLVRKSRPAIVTTGMAEADY